MRKHHLSKREIEERTLRVDQQTLGLMKNIDREYYIYRQLPEQAETVVLGSAAFDLAHKGRIHMLDESLNVSDSVSYIFRNYTQNSPLTTELLELYIEQLRKENYRTRDVDFIKRFYLDQRNGYWQSEINTIWDLIPTERLQFFACKRCLQLMLTASSQETDFLRKIIRNNRKELLNYPFNFDFVPPFWFRISQKIKHIIKKFFRSS